MEGLGERLLGRLVLAGRLLAVMVRGWRARPDPQRSGELREEGERKRG